MREDVEDEIIANCEMCQPIEDLDEAKAKADLISKLYEDKEHIDLSTLC